MGRLTASSCALIAVTVAGAGAQAQTVLENEQYLFIDAQKTRSGLSRTVNLSKVRERLVAAGDKGYAVDLVAGFSSSVNLLLKRGKGAGRSYRLVAHSRESSFLNELNQAASEGFRVVSRSIKAFEEGGTFGDQTTWVAVLEKQSDAPRIKYSVVKGTKEGEQALANSGATGRTLAGVLGRQGMVAANTLLFFEEVEGAKSAPLVPEQRDYKIIATARTSAMQKDLADAAAQGFRVVGAGFGYMTVVMARERGITPKPIEYSLIAMMRLETAVKELKAAGAQGFRVTAASENGQEGVFILHRTPGTEERFDYQVIQLQETTANQTLLAAASDGYRITVLLSDYVVLER